MTYYTYILECLDNSWYTGYTTDLTQRFILHKSSKGAKYTKAKGVSHLIVALECISKSQAMSLEYQIKKLSRKQKELLVNNLNSETQQILGVDILSIKTHL